MGNGLDRGGGAGLGQWRSQLTPRKGLVYSGADDRSRCCRYHQGACAEHGRSGTVSVTDDRIGVAYDGGANFGETSASAGATLKPQPNFPVVAHFHSTLTKCSMDYACHTLAASAG
jgi:hypothetical protein